MSRIPKPGLLTSADNHVLKPQEVKPKFKKSTSGNNITSGFKRPSDADAPSNEKRIKINSSKMIKRKPFSCIQPSNPQKKFAVKKGTFPPIHEPVIRSSMPAVVSSTVVIQKSKRPAWDLKGRMLDMEQNFSQRIAALEETNSRLHKDVEIKEVISEETSCQLRKLEEQLKQEKEKYEYVKNELESFKNVYQQETTSLKSSISTLTFMKSSIETQLQASQAEIEQLKNIIKDRDFQIESQLQLISNFETKEREGESLRRKLHNTILELKGNIRVFCRLRPPLQEEVKNGMVAANIIPITNKMIEIQNIADVASTESGNKMQPKYEFSFDYYFPPASSQEEVFNEISQLVQSALDGYNVCIFAYGQTGSGKTFTMEGPSDIVDFVADKNHQHLGMIPRSVQQIFTTICELESKGWKYKVEAMFLEIYNERIKDLLTSHVAGNAKCEIVKSGSKVNDCVISNVKSSEVTSAEQVYELLKKARRNRMMAATKCNEYSSRSHYIFQMKIRGENSFTFEKCDGTLNLVDLAGSERVKDSESAGERLTEAKAINKSLSTLGKVIMSLSRKDNHIPYRDSKLTHLLSCALGGNSKTLMFVNISPDAKNLFETISSLRFSTTVNQCNIGTAQKRIK